MCTTNISCSNIYFILLLPSSQISNIRLFCIVTNILSFVFCDWCFVFSSLGLMFFCWCIRLVPTKFPDAESGVYKFSKRCCWMSILCCVFNCGVYKVSKSCWMSILCGVCVFPNWWFLFNCGVYKVSKSSCFLCCVFNWGVYKVSNSCCQYCVVFKYIFPNWLFNCGVYKVFKSSCCIFVHFVPRPFCRQQ